MNESAFKCWLDAYGQAWESRDPRAAAELFVDDGTYQQRSFLEPLRGRQTILGYWTEVARTEIEISFHHEMLALTEQFGIAHWQASFILTPPGVRTKLDGIFVIRLNAEGKCSPPREWWHKQQ